ncbi:MAG: dihydrodipicolinate synthase family protein [Clostridia bacterium]|nr:dihydrodipicolinate synthase family protein [Clostridia bacterium]
MEKLKRGFYTAMGTPLDKDGNVVAESLIKEIDMQIEAGASGLLLMGSMGIEASVKNSAYKEAVRIAAGATKGRVPLFVGAMDNSIERVKDRIDMIKEYDFDAVVLTTPFYSAYPDAENVNFFEKIADYSPKPVFLYDLAVVTKQKITYSMVQQLSKHPNIKGIKSGDIVLARQVKNNLPDFEFLFSNIDIFDVAISYGIDKVLDGMFSSTPVNSKKFIEAAWAGDMETCKNALDNILDFRDFYITQKGTLLATYSESMNLLGMDGIFCNDYTYHGDDAERIANTKAFMQKIGEL